MSESKAIQADPGSPHHIALGAQDPERVGEFYTAHLGAHVLTTHRTPEGEVRSIWLTFGTSPLVLMLERTVAPQRPRVQEVEAGLFLLVLFFPQPQRTLVEAALEAAGVLLDSRTKFTSYTRDPEGNRVGLSSYVF